MQAGEIVIKTEVDNDELEKGLSETEKKTQEAQKRIEEAQERTNKAKEETARLNKEIEEYEEEISRIQQNNEYLKENIRNTNEIKNKINNINNSLKDTVKSVVRWGLAIFGIRGAFNFIRSSMSMISQQDKQLGADIEYMRNAIAYTLEPVIRGIVNLMKQLLTYIQYIIYAWTGKNIFENANKSLKAANGEARKLKKQLAGFDEMNILSDSSGGGGTTAPSFDLSKIDGEMPGWIDWIAKNGELIKHIVEAITGALIGLKVLGLDPIASLGLGLMIAGVSHEIESLIAFLKDPTFENFIGILEGMSVAILGVGLAFGFWPVALAGALALIVTEVVKHFDEIKQWFEDLTKWIDKEVRQKLIDMFGPLFGNVLTEYILYFVNIAKGAFESFYGGIKKVIDGVVKLFKGDFKSGISSVFGGLKDIMLAPVNALISGLNSLIKGVNKIKFDVPDWVPVFGGKKWGFDLPKIPKLAKGTIVSAPGKGVPTPTGFARYGEAGREAYLPLSDTQLLEELGSTLGKYINVNATIPIYVGNRQIARELRKINAEDDFAYNR